MLLLEIAKAGTRMNERPSALRQPPIAKPGQLFRAILFGLLLAFIFLWALPQSHFLFAADMDRLPATVALV